MVFCLYPWISATAQLVGHPVVVSWHQEHVMGMLLSGMLPKRQFLKGTAVRILVFCILCVLCHPVLGLVWFELCRCSFVMLLLSVPCIFLT